MEKTNPTNLIVNITLEEAKILGFQVFKPIKKNGEKFDRWKTYENQQLCTIRHLDKKNQLTNHLDLCYLKEGCGLGIKIPTSGGGEICEDVYEYLTTILL